MSYARWGWDGSDVYVYADVGGYLNCCGCWLGSREAGELFHESQHFGSTDAMLAHLKEHRAAGHTVPDDTFAGLEAERATNDAWLASQGASRDKEQTDG